MGQDAIGFRLLHIGNARIMTLVAISVLASTMAFLPDMQDVPHMPHMAMAADQAVVANSISFGSTAIIEIENNSDESMTQVRLWLGQDDDIESFKGEARWESRKNSVNVIIFSTEMPVMPGESAKFGVLAADVIQRINWKAMHGTNEMAVGISIPVLPVAPTRQPASNDTGSIGYPGDGDNTGNGVPPQDADKDWKKDAIYDVSTFRIVPERPNVGDTIRVAGMSFAQDRPLDFEINGEIVSQFRTDGMGNFVITAGIPGHIEPSRIALAIKDDNGNKKEISIRVGQAEGETSQAEEIKLGITEIPKVLHHGEALRVSGTAKPFTIVTVEILDPEGKSVSVRPKMADVTGNWVFELMLSQSAPYGQYTTVITQNMDTITRTWNMESSKTIRIESASAKYDPGDLMIFSGVVDTGMPVQFILENPQNVEIASDTIEADPDGSIRFTYQTEQSSPEGTYVLHAKQGSHSELIVAGLGELPAEQIVTSMDKLNYDAFEDAIIEINGPASSTISMLVIDPADREKFRKDIKLPPDGKTSYVLSLDGYGSGVYTAIFSRANTKTSETFSVGLGVGSGSIEISTTRAAYNTNDPILILGETNPNVLITLQLKDPDGNLVREKETFTDKDGRITDGTFRIPTDGKLGIWEVRASSGPNFAITEIEVIAMIHEGMQIFIDRVEEVPRADDLVYYRIVGAQNSVVVVIYDKEGNEIDTLKASATSDGIVMQPWRVPEDLPPGQYNMTAADAFNMASTLFNIK